MKYNYHVFLIKIAVAFFFSNYVQLYFESILMSFDPFILDIKQVTVLISYKKQ